MKRKPVEDKPRVRLIGSQQMGTVTKQGEEQSEVAWDHLPPRDNRRFIPNEHLDFEIKRVRLRRRLK